MNYDTEGIPSTVQGEDLELRATIRGNIKALMALQEVTQRQVAEKGGISQKLVFSLCTGMHDATAGRLLGVARGLNTDVRVLLTRWESNADLERGAALFRSVDELIALSPGQRETVLGVINGFRS